MFDKCQEQQQPEENAGTPYPEWTEVNNTFAQSILDSIDISMAILDTQGIIRAVNKIWEQNARADNSPEQMARLGPGTSYLEVCQHTQGSDRKEAFEALSGIKAVLRGEQPSFTMEYPCALPTTTNWYLMRVTPLQSGRGAVVAHIDITERKRLEQQKDLFIGMASHELQTPLTVLKALVQMEKRRVQAPGSRETEDLLTRMELQVNRLTKFVSELLDVARIQAGGFSYSKEHIDLDTLIREVVETTRQNQPDYSLIVHGKTGATIPGDRDKLVQVFTNLLNNAIKYSPGAHQVDIYLERAQEKALVKIRDYGIGIPKEYQSQIFEPFSRVAASKHPLISGLGMGLYIVREILAHHQGAISLASAQGEGTTFTVTLPLEE
jgi:signal transduction histidine kinase